MKRAICLIAAMLLSPLPIGAQRQAGVSGSRDRDEMASPADTGLLADAVIRQVARFGVIGESAASPDETLPQDTTPDDVGWARVRGLQPSTEIVVELRRGLVVQEQRAQPFTRYFVEADEATVSVRLRNVHGEPTWQIKRADVVTISKLTKHVGSHALRGAVIGAVFFGAVIAFSHCADCPPIAGSAILGGAIGGVLVGSIVGAVAPRSPDVIYRAP